MTKSAFTAPDRALENEWSDVMPDMPRSNAYPPATTRTSGLRPAIAETPPASERLPPPSRLPAIHPADEGHDRTVQRFVSVAELTLADAERTQELGPDQMSRLAAAALPSDVPPRPTRPVPAMTGALPPQAFPSLSELAGTPMPGVMMAPSASPPPVSTRPMPWMPTPPLPRSDRRLATALIVGIVFTLTAAIVLGAALFILRR